MPSWVMKTEDDSYRMWSTVVDAWVSDPLTRDEAVEEWGEDRIQWVDKHLCSCRARLGETFEIRNGTLIARGTGELAYHFDSYEEVARFCRTQEEMRRDEQEES